MHYSVMHFFMLTSSLEEFQGKRILEVGSYDVNGSLRYIIEKTMQPKGYIGIDIREGPGVDYVVPIEQIMVLSGSTFFPDTFDAIICTEVMEHVKHWPLAIYNMKQLLKPDGVIYLTTRSVGFPLHEYPGDYWRYSIQDIRNIFSDFQIVDIFSDEQCPGVFLKAFKPINWECKDLNNIKLYSMEND